jgi:hypothetical protein
VVNDQLWGPLKGLGRVRRECLTAEMRLQRSGWCGQCIRN